MLQKKQQKLTGNVAYSFIELELIFGIQLSSTDHYMISAMAET